MERPDRGPNYYAFDFDARGDSAGRWSDLAEECSTREARSMDEWEGGPGWRDGCKIAPLSEDPGYAYHSVWEHRWVDLAGGRKVMFISTRLYAEGKEGDEAWALFRLASGSGIGAPRQATETETRFGRIVHFPMAIHGTGNQNHDFFFLHREHEFLEIESRSWLEGLQLPPGHAVWKGIDIDLETFVVSSPVWREGDGNCCSSGGEISAELEVVDGAFVIKHQTYYPPEP